METIRRLDRNTERPGTILALVLGIIGTLLLGIGMCCTMVWAESWFVFGIIIGVMGIVILSGAYPIYKRITKVEREKVAEKILELTEEISL